VALACVAGQLGAVGHFALTPHERCAIHGDLVHAGEDHAHAAASRPDAVAVLPLDADEHPRAHEHCAILAVRQGLASTLRGEVAADVPAVAGGVEPLRTTRPAPIALLLLAPKSSPPAA
jgi:hypothetical protein